MNNTLVVFFLRHDFKEPDSIRLDIVQNSISHLTLHMVYILYAIYRAIVIDSNIDVSTCRIQKSDYRTLKGFGQFALVFNKMIFFVHYASIGLLRRPLIPETQNKKRRDSPFDRESRAALMYLISKMLARGLRKFYIAHHAEPVGIFDRLKNLL